MLERYRARRYGIRDGRSGCLTVIQRHTLLFDGVFFKGDEGVLEFRPLPTRTPVPLIAAPTPASRSRGGSFQPPIRSGRVLPSHVVTSRQAFEPRSTLLPGPQQRVLRELAAVPRRFVLYGGTAISLRLGHRRSLDFDLFSNDHFQPDALEQEIPLLRRAVRSRSEPDTLVSVVDRGGLVTVSFFGGLSLQRVADPELAGGDGPLVASLLDLAATKVKVVQDRAEAKDYVDVVRLLAEGISLREALGAALAVYGPTFNPLLSLKALAYFGDGDLPSVPGPIRAELERAVRGTRVEAIQPLTALPGGIAGDAPR